MSGRTVVVAGGGVGGVVAASRLRKLLPRSDRVVLVTREEQHLFQPSLLWLAVGTRKPEEIQRPIANLRRSGIDVRIAGVERIDAQKRIVETTAGPIEADAIVIALGAELAPSMVPGLAEGGHNLYSMEGAAGVRDALMRMSRGRVLVLTAAPAYKCPAAPYEAAMLIDGLLRRRGVRDSVSVDMYAAEPGPMGVAGPAVSAAVRGLLESKAVGYFPAHQVKQVDGASRRVEFNNGATVDYDLLVYVPPHRAPAAIVASGLVGETGWMSVDRETLATAFPMVFAIGDVVSLPLVMGKPLPKAGVFAHAQAEVVARNIANAWTGRGTARRFEGHGTCFIETGDGRAGVGSGNFFAEPTPQMRLRTPSRLWHWSKVLFEFSWFARWF